MKELAMQELKILEVEHPTKFQYLKLQLQEFISVLDEQNQQQQQQMLLLKQDHHFHNNNNNNNLSVLTQESSSKKRAREGRNDEGEYNKRRTRAQGIGDDSGAIRKAKACLSKIQTLKSFFRSSNH